MFGLLLLSQTNAFGTAMKDSTPKLLPETMRRKEMEARPLIVDKGSRRQSFADVDVNKRCNRNAVTQSFLPQHGVFVHLLPISNFAIWWFSIMYVRRGLG